jgi:hypothetical protein
MPKTIWLVTAVLAGLNSTDAIAQAVIGNPANAGCGAPPYTSCTNQIPATMLVVPGLKTQALLNGHSRETVANRVSPVPYPDTSWSFR